MARLLALLLLSLLLLPVACDAQTVNSMLTEAIQNGKSYTLKKCLTNAPRELNFRVLPQQCHEDMRQFYCQKVRDATSRNYRVMLQHECQSRDPTSSPVTLRSTMYRPPAIGFVILAHQYKENVKRLIMRLYEPGTTAFALHIDVKSSSMFQELSTWREEEQMTAEVTMFSQFNVIRGGPNMLQAELLGIRHLMNSSVPWAFCILLSEQDYPLRANSVLADWLWVHHDTNFISVDEGECERDVSFQCGDLVVSLSGGNQYPKIPGMRYGSGSQWFGITRALAAQVVMDIDRPSTVIGTIYRDLLGVKQPDESFFQAVILNSAFCEQHIDYTMHWTDKDSFREVRSNTSAYNILSPGVLGSGGDYFKLTEVRQQSLWAFFARKFDESPKSVHLRNNLDQSAAEAARLRWTPLQSVPAVGRLVAVLASSMASAAEISRLGRNKDSLFAVQTLRTQLHGSDHRMVFIREKWPLAPNPHPVLAIRVGCDWNKTELVFDGDVNIVSASDSGAHACEALWAVLHWRMSRQPIRSEFVLVWVDPKGTPTQHAPIQVSEQSVLLWHRYTATMPMPCGKWSIHLMTMDRKLVAQRTFFVYSQPDEIPWSVVHDHFEVVPEDPSL